MILCQEFEPYLYILLCQYVCKIKVILQSIQKVRHQLVSAWIFSLRHVHTSSRLTEAYSFHQVCYSNVPLHYVESAVLLKTWNFIYSRNSKLLSVWHASLIPRHFHIHVRGGTSRVLMTACYFIDSYLEEAWRHAFPEMFSNL